MVEVDPRRAIPGTDALLRHDSLTEAVKRLGVEQVKGAIRIQQAAARAGEIPVERILDEVLAGFSAPSPSVRPVLNATGVVLHTNLGRAALSEAAQQAVALSAGYVDVEYDLETGRRAARGRGATQALLDRVPLAEDALIVNNGAAALLLAVSALAAPGEVLVSRGELVEIGNGFRLPDLMRATGARLREVGTTNRTYLSDYATAIDDSTAAIVKIHPSNFRVEGYTASVEIAELAGLGLPIVADIGSGLLAADRQLPHEPDAASALAAGATLVTASGDKLLGGPQSGLVLGRSDAVQAMRRHPLARAVRVDKLTLAALEATLRGSANPTDAARNADPRVLWARVDVLARSLVEAGVSAELVESAGLVGGGSAPGHVLDGWAVALPAPYARELRLGSPAVVARVEGDRCLVDLRCVPERDDELVREAVLAAAARLPAAPE